ncbi:MAG: helix-turn-helix transcriptional regulator [Flavobacteriales bacterium]|nr:helix-turn-helix transcriptional regulator [Flavobacteriales bacterium]
MAENQCIRLGADVEQINSCKDDIKRLGESFDLLSGALSIAGNTVRLKILYLLSEEQELCVCDLSDILNLSVSAVSQHLRKMKDRNLIAPERKGLTIFYSLTSEYHSIFRPFFKLIEGNKILEAV